jgi:hypothetical protein
MLFESESVITMYFTQLYNAASRLCVEAANLHVDDQLHSINQLLKDAMRWFVQHLMHY